MSHDTNAYISDDAVHFQMHAPDGPLKVAVDAAALQRYFGARPEPESWLPSYVANFRVVHAVAQLAAQARRGELILHCEDFNEESIQRLREIGEG